MKTIILLAALLLTGCISSGTRVEESALQQFRKGTTTQADVEKALGKPQTVTLGSDGTHSVAYVFTSAHAKGASFIPIVGLFAGGAVGQTRVVIFHFGLDGKLTDYSSTASDADMNIGPRSGTATP